jgi:hypothetical protein
MMLFDPKADPSIKGGNMAGRQGREREIMRDKCNSETNKQKTDLRNVIWDETREGSPRPRG